MAKLLKNIVLLNHQWLYQELVDLGYNVVRAGWRDQGLDVKFPWRCTVDSFLDLLPKNFTPDLYLYYDDSSLPCFLDFENLPGIKVFYSVDTHHHLEWHVEFARLFHVTLVAQKDFVKHFVPAIGNRVKWFPLWATRNSTPQVEKNIDVCFRGTLDEGLHPGRTEFLQCVAKEVNLDFSMGDYEEPYTRSKIVINEAVRGDVNFRVFEGMMCGAMMLTPRLQNGLFDLFEEGKHIITFEDGSSKDAIAKIKYYLEHEEERVRIANAGRELVMKQFSNEVVARKLSDVFQEILDIKPELHDLNPSIAYYASLVRYLWLFVRKYEVENMLPHLETAINHLDQKLMNNQVSLPEDNPATEVAVVVIDSLLADLLDDKSYQIWLSSLDKAAEGRIPLITQLMFSFHNDHKQTSEEYEGLRNLFTENRGRFIASLSEFVN